MTFLLLAILTGVLLPASASAQDGPDPLLARADSLRAELDRMTAEYERLRESLPALAGEDSLITYRQSRELLLDGIGRINDLARVLVQQEEKGLDASALRPCVVDLLGHVPGELTDAALETQARIEDLSGQVADAGPAEIGLLEGDLAEQQDRLDDLFEMAADHLDVLQSVGVEHGELRERWRENLLRQVDLTAGRLELAVDEHARLRSQAESAPDDTDLARRVDAAQVAIDASVRSLERRVELMDRLDLDATEYRTLLVETTGEIARGLDAKVAVSLVQRWIQNAREWVADGAPGLLVKLVVFLAIVLAFRFVSRIVRRAVVRGIDSSKLKPSQLLRDMVANMSGNVVMALGLLIALSQIGVSLGPLLAGLGVAGFILGFALQETLANFASGLMILFYRPFDVGDLVEAAGVRGRVNHMSLVSTTILTIDNQTLIVPNGKIWGDVIRNVTSQDTRRVDLVFGIGYGDDVPKAEEVLHSILTDHPKVLKDPEPLVKLHELGDSSVNFAVRPWVKTEDYWDVYWDVTREVKMRFDREGIGIPFPQRDVHVYHETPSPEGPGEPA